MDEITLFLSILLAGFAFLLALVSFIAYYRLHAIKLLLVGMAFLGFVVKGILIAFGVFSQGLIGLVIDFVIIVFLYFAAIKK